MVDFLMTVLVIAGVFSMITVPLLVWSAVGLWSNNRRLEDRNTAQAAMIYRLQNGGDE